MDAFERLYKTTHENLPHINRHLVWGYMENELEGLPDFVGNAFTTAFSGIPHLRYEGWADADPVVHANLLLKKPSVLFSTLRLVEFKFRYDGPDARETVTIPLFLPYSVDGLAEFNGTYYALKRTINDPTFNQTARGGTVTVMRSPIHFMRHTGPSIPSMLDGWILSGHLIGVRIHLAEKLPPKYHNTVMHYLLAKFGLAGTCARFNIDPIELVESIPKDPGAYDYFPIYNGRTEYMLRVDRHKVRNDVQYRKIVLGIYYVLNGYSDVTGGKPRPGCLVPGFTCAHVNTGTVLFHAILAVTIKNDLSMLRATSHCDTHMASLEEYLDVYKQKAFADRGIKLNDAFDLLQHIFTEIEVLLLNRRRNNLFGARIDIVTPMIVGTVVAMIMKAAYKLADANGMPTFEKLRRELSRLTPTIVHRGITKANAEIQRTQSYSDASGHVLFACLEKLLTLGAVGSNTQPNSPELAMDPSQFAVNSEAQNSGKAPGATGHLNPYGEISDDGVLIIPSWASVLRPLYDMLNTEPSLR